MILLQNFENETKKKKTPPHKKTKTISETVALTATMAVRQALNGRTALAVIHRSCTRETSIQFTQSIFKKDQPNKKNRGTEKTLHCRIHIVTARRYVREVYRVTGTLRAKLFA